MATLQRVVIGMDPHKRSVTIEVMGADEEVFGSRRFGTDVTGFKAMTEYVKQWPDRVWAVEGCNGIGRHVAARLLAREQDVVDVPAEALGAGPGLLDRAGTQDRRHRRPLRGAGRHPHDRAAPGGRRRSARGATDAGRPAPRPW